MRVAVGLAALFGNSGVMMLMLLLLILVVLVINRLCPHLFGFGEEESSSEFNDPSIFVKNRMKRVEDPLARSARNN